MRVVRADSKNSRLAIWARHKLVGYLGRLPFVSRAQIVQLEPLDEVVAEPFAKLELAVDLDAANGRAGRAGKLEQSRQGALVQTRLLIPARGVQVLAAPGTEECQRVCDLARAGVPEHELLVLLVREPHLQPVRSEGGRYAVRPQADAHPEGHGWIRAVSWQVGGGRRLAQGQSTHRTSASRSPRAYRTRAGQRTQRRLVVGAATRPK